MPRLHDRLKIIRNGTLIKNARGESQCFVRER